MRCLFCLAQKLKRDSNGLVVNTVRGTVEPTLTESADESESLLDVTTTVGHHQVSFFRGAGREDSHVFSCCAQHEWGSDASRKPLSAC